MAELLPALLQAGLIEKIDGDDQRLEKLRAASEAVAAQLKEDPKALIGTILAVLDPEVAEDDPAIRRAKEALTAEWPTWATIHPDPPIGYFRSILLSACALLTDARHAAILWLTAADMLPHARLGREEAVIREALLGFAKRAEAAALESSAPEVPAPPKAVKLAKPKAPSVSTLQEVNRIDLKGRVEATVMNARGEVKLPKGNRYQPHAHPANWCWDYADRMYVVLADELDTLGAKFMQSQVKLGNELHAMQVAQIEDLETRLTAQRRWLRTALDSHAKQSRVETLQLEVLWWSEALYSPSLRSSYRRLEAPLLPVVMAMDLLEQTGTLTPASVGYLLEETVAKLPGAGFEGARSLVEWLPAVGEVRERLPTDLGDAFHEVPEEGSLSLRDLVVLALRGGELEPALGRSLLAADTKLCAPDIAHALFRQEQAVRLAAGAS